MNKQLRFSRLAVPAPKPTPINGLMDKNFVYTRSESTDIRKTFQRVIEARKQGAAL